MKLIQTLSFDCSACYGKGYLYYGGNEDWNIEPCDCNPNSSDLGIFATREAD
jgi:hypothetical protein